MSEAAKGVEAYADSTSVSPGETITFFINSIGGSTAKYTISVYRKGKTDKLVHSGSGFCFTSFDTNPLTS